MTCLTNAYCEGIYKAAMNFQRKCPTCGLWTVWENRKTHEIHTDCKCEEPTK